MAEGAGSRGNWGQPGTGTAPFYCPRASSPAGSRDGRNGDDLAHLRVADHLRLECVSTTRDHVPGGYRADEFRTLVRIDQHGAGIGMGRLVIRPLDQFPARSVAENEIVSPA